MDSLTQAALGAAVGHTCWQRRLGRRALIPGVLLGTLPDLDVVLYPVLDEVQRLYWHRGESHSVWFIVLGTIGFSWLLRRVKITKDLDYKSAMVGVFFILSTHILIDLFTVYGTQLLAPVSREGYAIGNMFIIDPLFTLPLLIGIIGAYCLKNRRVAWQVNQLGVLAAILYAAWSFSAQTAADQKFRSTLAELDFKVARQVTSAGPFNTLLWRHLAETPDGFLLGYWSWLDDRNQEIRFQFIPRNAIVVKQIKSTRTFEAVEWFSKGWWFAVKSDPNTVKVVDLRFTELPSSADQPYTQWQWPFAWNFDLAEQQESRLEAVRPDLDDPVNTLKLLARRITGQVGWLKHVE